MYNKTMENKRVLVVDDEADIREVLHLLLRAEGYRVDGAACGREALQMLAKEPDIIVLDVMMPGESGYEVCKAIRERGSVVPVLFLTARAQEEDKVQGLQCGADDYLAKPFSAAELVARVHALLRRCHVYQRTDAASAGRIVRGNVEADLQTGAITKHGQSVSLTDIERRIFLCLAERAGETIDGQTLYEHVWREPYLVSSASTIMVHIRNLRKKLEDNPQNPILIKTVWGRGYRIE